MPMKTEQREYRALELRAGSNEEQGNNYVVRGYASTFNEPYTLYEDEYMVIREIVDAHAFDETDMSDVIFQYNHEGRVFARTRNNTLEVSTDEHGLLIEADLGHTEIGRQLYDEIKGGYTDRMSFGFTVTGEEYADERVGDVDVYTRTITRVGKLYDVSAVSIPANDGTSISIRNLADGVISKREEAERLAEEMRKKKTLKLKLKLMEEI